MKLEKNPLAGRLLSRLGRWRPAAVAAIALLVLAAGALLITPRLPAGLSAAEPLAAVAGPAAGRNPIAQARARLARLPGDWRTWARLGQAYLEQARVSADPARYGEAEQALRRSLEVRPDGNADALTGLGALAAARHDFAEALRLGRQAVAADPYSATAHGVLADALIELGRYDEAWDAVQDMVDLRPDTGSYARASYTRQLRGDTAEATALMRRALQAAGDPAQAAFALEHLAGLAFGAGDLTGAGTYVDDGLRRLPGHPPLLAVRARIAAARDDTVAAKADWTAVLRRLPLPGYAAEYGDLLAAFDDRAGAKEQYDLVRVAAAVQAAQGVDVDLELAVFHADHGDPAAAVAAAQAVHARRPTIAADDALAWALHSAGRDAEALPYADRALRLDTRDAALYFHRGMIAAALAAHPPVQRTTMQRTTAQQAAALKVAARRDLRRALGLNPHFSPRHAPAARAALATLDGAR